MSKETEDEYKVVAFKTLLDDDEGQVVLPAEIHVVQSAEHLQQMTSQRSVQSMRKIAGSWSSFGDDSGEQLDENEQLARLRTQLSAQMGKVEKMSSSLSSSSLSSDRRMAIATSSQVQSSQMQASSQMQSSSQIHMQKQMQRISNFRQQSSNVRSSMEKQEFNSLQSIDESKEISTSPIHLKVVTSRNRIQMHHVHTVQEFRSKM